MSAPATRFSVNKFCNSLRSQGIPATKDTDARKRETSALEDAMRELRIGSGTIVTWLDLDSSDERVRIVPAWRWLLDS